MLNACMIDGFGWFNEADYRRSWLFFDQVDYLFPTEIKGPLRMPAALASNPLFAVVRPRSSEATIEYLINESKSDAANLTYAKLVRALVPSADLEYASMIVFSDRELQIKLNHSMLDSVFSLSYLVNKLLLYSAITGAVPIFGRHYATEIVGYKIQRSARFLSRQRSAAIVEPDRMTSISAIAAGLSLGFIQDQDLKQISAKQLLGFKEKTFSLLQRHQAHLIDISQNFECLPSDDEFPAQLTKLRLQAMKERISLDGEMRDLWLSSGMARSLSSSLPAQGFQTSALGLIKQTSLKLDLGPGNPELKISIEIDGASGEGRPNSRKLASGMFYLFEAQKFLSGDVDGKRSERNESIYLEIAPGRPADADPTPLPTAEIRRLILLILPSDADLLAFCMDCFPTVCQRFGDNMDRMTKINWLLKLESQEDILKHLSSHAPDTVAKYMNKNTE